MWPLYAVLMLALWFYVLTRPRLQSPQPRSPEPASQFVPDSYKWKNGKPMGTKEPWQSEDEEDDVGSAPEGGVYVPPVLRFSQGPVVLCPKCRARNWLRSRQRPPLAPLLGSVNVRGADHSLWCFLHGEQIGGDFEVFIAPILAARLPTNQQS